MLSVLTTPDVEFIEEIWYYWSSLFCPAFPIYYLCDCLFLTTIIEEKVYALNHKTYCFCFYSSLISSWLSRLPPSEASQSTLNPTKWREDVIRIDALQWRWSQPKW
jgi:hypothetical protein